MSENLDKHVLGNGMVLLGEPMEAVQSVAFDFMLPCGAATLLDGCCGAGSVISDWIFRGAGDRDSRQLSDALDGLGLHRATSVNSSHTAVGAALEAGNILHALDLYADIVLRPNLDADEFDLARQLAIESVRSLDDDPRHKVMLKLREQFYPDPLGRSSLGEIDQLAGLTVEQTMAIVKERFNLSQTIFAIAGKYDFDAVCKQAERLFGCVESRPLAGIKIGRKGGHYVHIPHDGAQVHIGLMTPTVTVHHEDYYNARVAISVLSGGMSARLFTEVREKRGLCYAVGASYHGLKDAAGVACYAGTTPEKAQETFDVIVAEFKRLVEGISEDEIARAKVGLKSSLILNSESSSSRAGSIGTDYYILGRVRSLDEIKEKIEVTTVDSVLDFLRRNPLRQKDLTVVTIGPREIDAG